MVVPLVTYKVEGFAQKGCRLAALAVYKRKGKFTVLVC